MLRLTMFLWWLALTLCALTAQSMPHAVTSDPAVAFDLTTDMNGFTFKRAVRISEPTVDRPSMKYSRLKRVHGQHETLTATSALSRRSRHSAYSETDRSQNITAVGEFSTQYAIQCDWDGETVWLLFDTGSSDTWATKTGFRCRDSSGEVHPELACGFGQPLIDDFAHGTVDDLHFFLQYGSGERVSGPLGRSDISCGGLSVQNQQVGLANSTYWHGNNATVGILGLAYPSLTSAYYGQVGDEAPWNTVKYPPFFTTAVNQGSIDPVFSVAIMRNSSDGIIGWGGLPPIGYDRQVVATADIITANLAQQDETAWSRSFYTIIPDGVRWGTTMDEGKYPYIVDTGTTMMYLPPPLVEAIAMAFVPQAVYLYQWGTYFVSCEAMPPWFAVIIDGVDFWINPADLILPLIDPLTGYCALGITTGGSGPYILGDVFLQNVLAVFDVGGGQMRFYPRR